MKRYMANTIIIDHQSGDIVIDGAELPWYVQADGPEVELDSPINIVTIPIMAENVIVVRSLRHELEAIRQLARDAINEDVNEFKKAASKARQDAQHRHHRRMIELRVEKRRREGTLMRDLYDGRPGGREEEQYEAAIAAKERGAERVSFSITEAIKASRGERL